MKEKVSSREYAEQDDGQLDKVEPVDLEQWEKQKQEVIKRTNKKILMTATDIKRKILTNTNTDTGLE